MTTKYYAHTAAGGPEEDWEPLIRHLNDVVQEASSRGRRFGADAIAGLAGRLHDIGKYTPAFQARLRGSTQRVDHATAGAVWAFERLPQKWGRVIAHTVAGHHSGLQNELLKTDGRIESKRGAFNAVVSAAETDGVGLPQSVSGPPALRGPKEEFGFRMAFLTRMVFACPLDADRSTAAAFMARARGESAQVTDYPWVLANNSPSVPGRLDRPGRSALIAAHHRCVGQSSLHMLDERTEFG
jgi:CRISPR-associated endonuclease/helicase Cas3